MSRRRKRPERDGDRVTDFRPVLVDEPAKPDEREPVSKLKDRIRQPVLGVAPAQLLIERLFQQREDLPINIIDGGGEEEQRADDLAIVSLWFRQAVLVVQLL